MTLLHPKTLSGSMILFLIGAVVLVVVSTCWVVVEYNRSVNTRHVIRELERGIKTAEAENADLKDQVVRLLSGVSDDGSSQSNFLVKEKSPRFISLEISDQPSNRAAVASVHSSR